MQVWKTPAEGGQALQVTKEGGGEASESFDAKWLYYFKHHSSREGIWRLPLAGGEEEPVFDYPAGWGYWALREDGICFVNRKATPRPAIEFFNFANRRVNRLTTIASEPKVERPPGFTVSPDGQWVLYTHLDQFDTEVMLLDNFR